MDCLRGIVARGPARLLAIGVIVAMLHSTLAYGVPAHESHPATDQQGTSDLKQEPSAAHSEGENAAPISASAYAAILWPLYQQSIERIETTDERMKAMLHMQAGMMATAFGLDDAACEQLAQLAGDTPGAPPSGRSYIQLATAIARDFPERSQECYRKAFEAALHGDQENASRVLDFLPRQLAAGFCTDAVDQAKQIKDPELRCRALLPICDAVFHAGDKEQALSVLREVREMIAETTDTPLRQRLEAELAKTTKMSTPFSPAAIERLVAPWRSGDETADATLAVLLDYVDTLQRRGDQKGVDATFQAIEDHLLEEIAKVTPPSRLRRSSVPIAWSRLLGTCYQMCQYDRCLRLLAAMDVGDEKQCSFVAQNLSRLCSSGPMGMEPLRDRPRESLQEMLRLCEEIDGALLPGHDRCGYYATILKVRQALGDEADVQEALQPFVAAAQSPSSWDRGASNIGMILAEAGEIDGLETLLENVEEPSRDHIRGQIVEAMARRGRSQEALKLAQSLNDPEARCTAMGIVAAGMYQRQGADRVTEFVRKELAALAATSSEDRPAPNGADPRRDMVAIEFAGGLIASGYHHLNSLRP